jgi:hypothetical protein
VGTGLNQLDRFKETIASYRKHGWQLSRVLMCEPTVSAMTSEQSLDLEGVVPEVSSVDALWFTRLSHAGRVAWEIRLVGDSPYALFEAFESDCDEELREETLREMQARLIQYATRV